MKMKIRMELRNKHQSTECFVRIYSQEQIKKKEASISSNFINLHFEIKK